MIKKRKIKKRIIRKRKRLLCKKGLFEFLEEHEERMINEVSNETFEKFLALLEVRKNQSENN